MLDNSISKLVLDNDKLVHYFVRKIGKGEYEYDDLVQTGRMGLLKAAKTYDGRTKFATYASRCITNELLMYFRKNNKHMKNKVSLEDCVCIDSEGDEVTYSMIIEDKGSNFCNTVENCEMMEKAVNIALNVLPLNDKLVWLYVIAGKTQKYIAKKLNITQSYVSRIYSRAYKKVRAMYEKNIKYMEVYHMKVNTNCCSISFCTKDTEDVNKVITELLKKLASKTNVKITRKGQKISINFPVVEECFDPIAYLISNVDKYSIDLTCCNNEFSSQFDEKLAKSGDKIVDEVFQSKEIYSLYLQIMESIKYYEYFHKYEIYVKFREYSSINIDKAIQCAVQKKMIKPADINGYYTVCDQAKYPNRYMYSVSQYLLMRREL